MTEQQTVKQKRREGWKFSYVQTIPEVRAEIEKPFEEKLKLHEMNVNAPFIGTKA